MAENKYLNLAGLQIYDAKLKALIDEKDAAVLAAAKEWANGLADNYDAAGSAKTVQDALDAYKKLNDPLVVAAQNAADKAQEEVDALETLIGTLPEGTAAKTVVEYVNKKTEGIATDAALGELQGQLTAAQGDITAIKGDYLKNADKEALQGQIDDVNELIGDVVEGKTVVEMISDAQTAATYDDTKVKEDIKKNADNIKVIADDYLKGADKTELTTAINTEKSRAEGIEAGLDTRLGVAEGKITAVEGRMTTAEGEIDALQEQIGGLTGAMHFKGVVDAVPANGAEGYVSGDVVVVSANKKEYVYDGTSWYELGDEGSYLTKTEASSSYETKEDAGKKLTEAKGHADSLNTAMDARMQTVEGKAHTHTFNEAELNKIAEGDVEKWNKAQANAEATAASALSAAKTELQGKIDAEIQRADAAEKKALADAKAYTDQKIGDVDLTGIATNAQAIEALGGRMDTAEGKISTLEGDSHTHENETVLNGITSDKVGAWDNAATKSATNEAAIALLNKTDGSVGSVKKTVDDAITALDLANSYDAKGAAAAVNTSLETYVSNNNTRVGAVEGRLNALEANTYVAITDTEINALFQ